MIVHEKDFKKEIIRLKSEIERLKTNSIEQILTTKRVGRFLTFSNDPFGGIIQVTFVSHLSNREYTFYYEGIKSVLNTLKIIQKAQKEESNRVWLQELIDDLKE